jgi:hypothetical protein
MANTHAHDRVSRIPFGIGFAEPHHYLDIARIIWENRDNLPYAWRILRHGVCDGCSLGPKGLRDDTLGGVRRCMTRLRLLRLNNMPALESCQASGRRVAAPALEARVAQPGALGLPDEGP